MRHALLRIETGLALALAWGLVFLVPLRWTRRLFGGVTGPAGAGPAVAGPTLVRARAVAGRVARVAAALPWRSTCLVRAVAGQLLLVRRGIRGGIIRFGVRKRAGAFEAHAWLLLGGTILLGAGEADTFVPIADLSAIGGRPGT